MNPYTRNANRIEFVITYACTGRCIHCSEGDHTGCTEHIDADAAVAAVRGICSRYGIKTLMTFGGEPLLHPDTVCRIHAAAREAGIPRRQIITNGFFSRDAGKIRSTALALAEAGVTEMLLSVDAFHQETIPLEPVLEFARAISATDIYLRTSPAWLVSREDNNPYNIKTRELLKPFSEMGIPVGNGNVIFPSGNAVKYLSEYFDMSAPPENPYVDDPFDVTSFCFDPDGSILGGNIYRNGILDIIDAYDPGK